MSATSQTSYSALVIDSNSYWFRHPRMTRKSKAESRFRVLRVIHRVVVYDGGIFGLFGSMGLRSSGLMLVESLAVEPPEGRSLPLCSLSWRPDSLPSSSRSSSPFLAPE